MYCIYCNGFCHTYYCIYMTGLGGNNGVLVSYDNENDLSSDQCAD
jgi:hypothetical protein